MYGFSAKSTIAPLNILGLLIRYVYNNSSLAFSMPFSCPDVIYSLSYLVTVSRLEAVPSSFMLNLRVRVGA